MKILRKSIAILLAIAMILSVMSIGVFAAETPKVTVSFAVDKTQVKIGGSVLVSVNVIASQNDLATSFTSVKVGYDSTNYSAEVVSSEAGVTATVDPGTNELKAGTTAAFTLRASEITFAKFRLTPKVTSEVASKEILTIGENPAKFMAADYSAYDTTVGSSPLVAIKQGFDVASAVAVKDSTEVTKAAPIAVGIGTTLAKAVEGVTATLKDSTGTKTDIGYTIDWDENTNYKPDDTAAAQEVTGKVSVDGTKTANATAEPVQVKAYIKVGKIALDEEGVVVDTITAKTYQKAADDATVKSISAADVATAVNNEYRTVDVKKGEYTGKANISWSAASDAAPLDLTKVTDDEGNSANVVTLTGTLTVPDNSEYFKNGTSDKTVTMNVKVVPAEITGSKFSVDNAAQYGNAKVTFTIPGAEVNGKKVTAYMYTQLTTDGKIDETSLAKKDKVEGKVNTDEIKATVTSEEGAPVTYEDYTGSLQFPSFDSLGLTTNNKFYVVLKVDTATVKNGEDMYVESYVLPESNRRPGSSGGNSGGTVVVKKHDVKVTEGTNGTATVDKEAKVGDTVKVDVKPNEGYKVKEIIVKTADGKTVEVDQKNRTFVMPDGDVTVEVVYEEGTEEPTVADGKFTDVPDTFWAAADIYTLKEAGIINGKSDKEFDPEGKVTRAEFTKMIVNLFGVKASQNTVAFTDCKADDWFTPFVAAAVEAGYVKGITDTEFAPDKTITREEACTILGRAYAKTSDKALNFTDASGISDFATAYVALLVDMGYVNGYEDGTFLPKNEITRAEAAKIIASAFRAAEKAKTEVTEDKTEAKDNADADVKADDKTDAKADDKAEVKADDKTDAKADAKTDAKADNGEKPEK